MLEVNRIGLGAMRLCGPGVWGWPADRENALRVLRRAVELGVDFIDTADAYGPHVNEEQIAEALFPYPEGLTIATKGGSTRSGPGQWGRDGRPAYLREACEGSLRRLRVECIDLYQLHAVDPNVPFEEQIGTLRELRNAGKIRRIGLSNVDRNQVEKARDIVEIASVQNSYNVADRESEPVLRYCEEHDMTFIPYFPLDAGDISGDVLAAVAEQHQATPFQIALAWLLRHSRATLPIPGTSSVAHLADNVGAAKISLTDAQYERLSALAA
jgi:pyridoxine 4-dehydrogenase